MYRVFHERPSGISSPLATVRESFLAQLELGRRAGRTIFFLIFNFNRADMFIRDDLKFFKST